MANVIRTKRSAVPAKVPLTTDLQLGEIAINTYDGKMYIKKDVSGVESVVQVGAISGGGDLLASNNLADLTNTNTARTNLGLAIGTNVLAYDAGLQSIAGLTTAADRMIYTTASDTYAVTTLTAFGRSIIDDANASAARTTLGLANLATTTASAFALTILDDADGAAVRTTIGAAATSHTHAASDITSGTFADTRIAASNVTQHNAAIAPTWTNVSGKPSTFTPAAHTHVIADITGLQTALDGKAATSHTHTLSQISDMSAYGRTLVDDADAAAARTTLGLANLATITATAFALTILDDADAGTVRTTIGAAASSHTHTLANITEFGAAGGYLRSSGSAWVRVSGVAWADLTSVPSTFTPSAHVHAAADVTSGTFADARIASSNVTQHNSVIAPTWGNVSGKPSTFTPATHTHAIADVTGLQTAIDGKAATSHTHAAADITSGVLATARLGTGTADSTVFLRGDGAWVAPASGSELVDVETADFNFIPNTTHHYLDGTATGTLPASPPVGTRCYFMTGPNIGTLTVARNGQLIEGLAENMTASVPRFNGGLVFLGGSKGWEVFTG